MAEKRRLTHLDASGKAHMVDISHKEESLREAVARGRVRMAPETVRLIAEAGLPKGDVLTVARIAGIMAAKRASETIPMCHPIPLSGIDVKLSADPAGSVEIEARVRTKAATGVEMEALAAVTGAALTVYDMCKSADREMVISDICLVEKRGGSSGDYRRAKE